MTAQYFLFVTFTEGPSVRINPMPGQITEANEEQKKEEFKNAFLRRLDKISPETKARIKQVNLCKEKGNLIMNICQVYPELN